ncbi:lysophospholipid acyltransferase family protein [Paenibacillus cremeus]|uniref:Lipid A biosynthesis acyltransferase n=1 Tax=Paenibacillus cremeus TaxID=2163881 RepID=A0A559KDC3_9BACL|nr:lipid A biosynthesis acyltransferase [Paenibacillus cremeus]TVY10130.1 lipid A biosynthesis acyltransferase [Paenibacillus cremeus]
MYDWIGKAASNERLLQRWVTFTGWLPRSWMLGCCRITALLLFWVSGRDLREKVLGNLLDLLPKRSEADLRRIRLSYFQNLVITLYEIVLEAHRLAGSEHWRFQVEGEAHLEEALRLGRGAIVYTPHEGNFFYYYWYLCQKYDCLTVATAGSAELRPLYLKFQAMGCPGLDYDNTPPLELLRRLRKHLQGGGVVFLLGDFWRPTFPRSRLFGRDTRTPDGASSLSIEQQVPVIPLHGWRERGWVHRLQFEPALHLSSAFTSATRSDATMLLNRFMERVITECPEQWFYWFNAHERWEIHHASQKREAERPQEDLHNTHSA